MSINKSIILQTRTILSLVFIFILSSCNNAEHERKEIHRVWDSYQQSLSLKMGSESIKYIDSASLNFYTYMLGVIRTADSNKVESLPVYQKILVLGIRQMGSTAYIRSMDGRSLFAYCVQTGLLGSAVDEKSGFRIKNILGNTAYAEMVDSSGKAGLDLQLHKENGQWKVNLTTVYAKYADETWKIFIKQSGKTEREFIDTILDYLCGEKPRERTRAEIWHPVN